MVLRNKSPQAGLKAAMLLLAALMLFSACQQREVVWNGETEYFANLLMVEDVSDPCVYVGLADYVFVGTVEQIDRIVLPDKRKQHEDGFSSYQIRVDQNLKGNLQTHVVCSKLGGLRSDGTMLLAAAEMPDGRILPDTGLPEPGKQYIFLAYAQQDGSLTLSELFDNRICSEALIEEYTDYVEHAVPNERQRFPSNYDAGAENEN